MAGYLFLLVITCSTCSSSCMLIEEVSSGECSFIKHTAEHTEARTELSPRSPHTISLQNEESRRSCLCFWWFTFLRFDACAALGTSSTNESSSAAFKLYAAALSEENSPQKIVVGYDRQDDDSNGSSDALRRDWMYLAR